MKAKGLLIIYVNVGSLSPTRAEALVERWKDRFFKADKKVRDWELPDDLGTVWVPTRNQDTEFQYINFSETDPEVLEKIDRLMEAIENNWVDKVEYEEEEDLTDLAIKTP